MTDEPVSPFGGRGFTKFDFICTDKGQHREFPLRAVMVRAGSGDFFDDLTEYTSFRPAGRQSMLGGAPEFDEFFCAGCGRNLRINHQNLVELVQRLGQLGITVLDISQLPF